MPSPLPRSESPRPQRPLSPADVVRVGGGYDVPENSHGARFAAYVAEHGEHHVAHVHAAVVLQAGMRGWRARALSRRLRLDAVTAAAGAEQQVASAVAPGAVHTREMEEQGSSAADDSQAVPQQQLRVDHQDAFPAAEECEELVHGAADTAAAPAEQDSAATVLTDAFDAASVPSVLAADAEVEVIAAAALRHSSGRRSAAGAEHSPASEAPAAAAAAAADTAATEGGQPDAEAPEYETASRDPLPPPRWLSMPPPLIPFPTTEPQKPTAAAPPPVAARAPAHAPARRRMPGIPTGVEAEALKAWDSFRQAQSQRYTVLLGSSSSFGTAAHAAGRHRSTLAVLPASRPACVRLHALANLPLSHAAASVLASGGELFARLHVSLFDGASCAFFGAVAVTELARLVPQPQNGGSEALYTAQLNAAVYLHTRVADARALLVCDVHLVDPRSPHVTHEAGWAAVPLVQPPRDQAAKATWMPPGVITDVALRQGAPRALLASASQPRPPPLGFAQLSYGVHACPGFAASCGLVPPDFPVTARDAIPGIRAGNQSLEMPQLCPLRRLAIQSLKVDLQRQPWRGTSPLLAVRVTAHNGRTFCAAPVAAWLVKSRVAGGSGEHTMLIQDGGKHAAALEVECPQSAQVALVWELVAAPPGSGDTARPPPLDAPVLAWGTALVFGGGPEDDVAPSPEVQAGIPPERDDDPTGHLLRGSYAAHLRSAAGFPLRVGVHAVDMGDGGAVATITFEVDDAHQLRLAAASTAAAPPLSEEPTVRSGRRPRVSASCDALRRSVIDAHDAQLTELAALHAEQLRAARMTLDVSDKTLGMVAVQQARRLDALASQLRAKLEQLEQTQFDDERAAESAAAGGMNLNDESGSVQRPARAPSPPGRTQSLRVRASQRHRHDGDETGQLGRALSDVSLSVAASDEAAPQITEVPVAALTAVEESTPAAVDAPARAGRSPSPIRAAPHLADALRAQAALKEGASLMDAQDEVGSSTSGPDSSASVRERHKHEVIMATLRQGLQTLPERSASDRVRTRLAQRTFDVNLSDGCLKKIVHVNASDMVRTWRLRSSHPDLMVLSPDGDMTVQPGGSVAIAVQLAPVPAWKVPCASADGVADVLVFVNDEADTNEAVFRLRVRQQ